MTGQPTVLGVLLRDRGLERYGTFRSTFNKAARAVDADLGGTAPSRAQFHRWLTGAIAGLPYPDHCRVLEQMLPGYSARQLFQPCPAQGVPAPAAPGNGTAVRPARRAGQDKHMEKSLAGVAAVFASRSDFAATLQPQVLLGTAQSIRAAGLSLNLICQQVPDQQLRTMLEAGTQLTCLFLDPDGQAIQDREREELHPPGHLSTLTRLNIQVISRLRDRLPAQAQPRICLAVYDETIRFNIILIDDQTCILQPYLPQARGIDSPTLVIRHNDTPGGLYPVFQHVYEELHARSKQI